VVGCLEKDRYPAQTMPAFDTFLDEAFEFNGLRIYRVPESSVVPTS
jgi:hypothetical protein